MVKRVLGAALALSVLLLMVNLPQVDPLGLGIIDFKDIKDVVGFFWGIYEKGNSVYGTIDSLMPSLTLEDLAIANTELQSDMRRMEEHIDKRLDHIEKKIEENKPSQLSDKLKELGEYWKSMKRLLSSLFNHLKNHQDNVEYYHFLIKTAPSGEDSTSARIEKMHDLFFTNDTTVLDGNNLILHFRKEIQAKYLFLCGMKRSPHEFIYEVYNIAMDILTRGMFITSVVYRELEIWENKNGSRRGYASDAFETFSKNTDAYTQFFENLLKGTNRTLRSCDPNEHIRGKTFLEFERLIGTVIINEKATNRRQIDYDNCGDYGSSVQVFGCDSDKYGCVPTPESCYGRLEDCVNSDATTDICRGDRNNSDTRRYAWVKDRSTGKTYGEKEGNCINDIVTVRSKAIHDNSNCRCTCFEDDYFGRGKHFVSIRPVTANIFENKVVTGIKFVNTDNIIQLKIQQGKLGPYARIALNDTQWLVPEELSYDKRLTEFKKRFVFHKRNRLDDTYEEIKNDIDIAILTEWKRTFNLDELYVPKDHVLTGVKFSRIITPNKANPQPIQLEIQATPFNYTTGLLILERNGNQTSRWISAADIKQVTKYLDVRTKQRLRSIYKNPRRKVQHSPKRKSPVHSRRTLPDFTPNQFIELTQTSIEEDYGQTVVPLLDAIEVKSYPPVPLSGLSLFHKAAKDYGGFLSFQIITFDRSDRMQYNKTAAIQILEERKRTLSVPTA